MQHYSSNGTPFYINSPISTLRLCFGVLHLASTIQRFPLLPNDVMRYVDITSHVCICVLCCTVCYLEVTTSTHFLTLKGKSFIVDGGEMVTLYQAPMVDIGGTQVFVGDFVTVSPFPVPSVAEAVGKIVRLYTKVRTYLRCIIEHS